VGFFGNYVYTHGRWALVDADAGIPPQAGVWLSVSIHDSDFTMVRYFPPGAGNGEAFLGFTPRVYFEEPSASAPTNAPLEAVGLVSWTRAAGTGVAPRVEVIEAFLATDEQDDQDEDADLPADEVFAELKTARFVTALGLPDLPLRT
jgi:hypothetical protein